MWAHVCSLGLGSQRHLWRGQKLTSCSSQQVFLVVERVTQGGWNEGGLTSISVQYVAEKGRASRCDL